MKNTVFHMRINFSVYQLGVQSTVLGVKMRKKDCGWKHDLKLYFSNISIVMKALESFFFFQKNTKATLVLEPFYSWNFRYSCTISFFNFYPNSFLCKSVKDYMYSLFVIVKVVTHTISLGSNHTKRHIVWLSEKKKIPKFPVRCVWWNQTTSAALEST